MQGALAAFNPKIIHQRAVDPHRVAGVEPLRPSPGVHEQGGKQSGPNRCSPHLAPSVPPLGLPPGAGAVVPIRLANGRSEDFSFTDRDPTNR